MRILRMDSYQYSAVTTRNTTQEPSLQRNFEEGEVGVPNDRQVSTRDTRPGQTACSVPLQPTLAVHYIEFLNLNPLQTSLSIFWITCIDGKPRS